MGIGFSQHKDTYIIRAVESSDGDFNDKPKPYSKVESLSFKYSDKRAIGTEVTGGSKIKESDKKAIPLTKGRSGKMESHPAQIKVHPDTQPSRSKSTPKIPTLIYSQYSQLSKTVCSEYYPWLLKSTKFQGASLSEFEFGRVIGMPLIILENYDVIYIQVED